MSILLSGGAGYIGSVVAKSLALAGHRVVVIDSLVNGFLDTISTLKTYGDVEFVKADVGGDLDSIFLKYDIKSIFHFAAFIEVYESTKEPLKYYKNNTANLLNILAYAQKYKVKEFVFSSTAAVYGEPASQNLISETAALNPINPYGASKMMCERIIADFARSNPEFKFTILRYFNVAGASSDVRLGQRHKRASHLVRVAVQAALGLRESVSIFGDDYPSFDGTCVRDYIHIEDLASAHLAAFSYIKKSQSEIFNVGYGRGFSVKQVLEVVKRVSGVSFAVKISKRRAGDPAFLVADASKLRLKTKWQPKFDDLNYIVKTALQWESGL